MFFPCNKYIHIHKLSVLQSFLCTRQIYLDRIRKSLVKSNMNLSSSVITFYHSENTIVQWVHGVHILISTPCSTHSWVSYNQEFFRLLKLDYPILETQNNGYLGGKYNKS